jgi:hypothetical protein
MKRKKAPEGALSLEPDFKSEKQARNVHLENTFPRFGYSCMDGYGPLGFIRARKCPNFVISPDIKGNTTPLENSEHIDSLRGQIEAF